MKPPFSFTISENRTFLPLQLLKLGFHGGVVAGKFFDRNVVQLVVGQAELVFAGGQEAFDFLHAFDGLVDFINGFFEVGRGGIVVLGKGIFEDFQIFLKMPRKRKNTSIILKISLILRILPLLLM